VRPTPREPLDAGAAPLAEDLERTKALLEEALQRGTMSLVVEPFELKMQRGGASAIREAERFFMREDAVHRSLRKITSKLKALEIPYAVAGAMALVAHGYDRTTVDVDVLVPADALSRVHAALDGLGYLPPFVGSKALRDTETGVRIDFLVAGQFPGDKRPKPIVFPDPSTAAVEIDGIRFLSLEKLIELKLASGMINAGRIKDLADVQELIRVLRLDEGFADRLDAFVRPKYSELWNAVASTKDSDPSG